MTRIRGGDRPSHFLRKHLFLGAAMIATGTALLLAAQGIIPLPSAWLLLPILVGVWALTRLVFAREAQQFAFGVLGLAQALWIYACLANLWGCTFGTTWPVAVIFSGLSVLIHQSHCSRSKRSEERA